MVSFVDWFFSGLMIAAGGALCVTALIASLNALTFPRLRRAPAPARAPFVSILIPARNEAPVIAETVRSLLKQTYPWFEILLLDDQSDDGTGEIAQRAAGGDARLQVIAGENLLAGWLGKNWACHQLSQRARGEILIFTDADVRWSAGALEALISLMERERADLLTVWPTQTTITMSERLVVPLMALVVLGYLPALAVHHLPFASLAAANGQCLAFRRKAYAAVGGHVGVRGEIVEDVQLARRIKRRGLRLRMADGAGLIGCRMYRNWRDVRRGYAKNILAGYGGRASLLLIATLFHWLIFLVPPLWMLVGWVDPAFPRALPAPYPVWPLLLTALGILIRALTASTTRQRVRDALLMPISVLLMTLIAGQALWWQWRHGGPQWKGRTIRRGAPS